jgi:leucyl-tRNA synthetase
MSKSKGNTVSPADLIERYGADTVRLYTLFLGPPERDAEWEDRAVEGAHRFLLRYHRIFALHREALRAAPARAPREALTSRQTALLRKSHETIRKAGEDLSRFHYNTAVSALMELLNATGEFLGEGGRLGPGDAAVLRETMEAFTLLLAPVCPHLAEEVWEGLGHGESVFRNRAPEADPALLERESYVLVVSVNGKVRSRLTVPAGLSRDAIEKEALRDVRVRAHVEGRTVERMVHVPGKLLNVVVRGTA